MLSISYLIKRYSSLKWEKYLFNLSDFISPFVKVFYYFCMLIFIYYA